jgi:hypothetical protein
MMHCLRPALFSALLFFTGAKWAQSASASSGQTTPSPAALPAASAPAQGQASRDAGRPGESQKSKDAASAQGSSAPGKPAEGEQTAQPEAAAAPSELKQPKTEILDTSATAGALATDGHDPILDPPPFPKGITTLVGGVISSVDPIRNHLTISIYGGGHWTVFYDERTHIFRNGAEATSLTLKKGERVYVDTMLDNDGRDIFARNIRVGITAPPAVVEGQIIDVDLSRSLLTMRDSINTVPVHFSVDGNTKISQGAMAVSLRQLHPGSLVRVRFAAERANRGLARDITIIAVPGSSHTFAGPITFLDTHRGIVAVHNNLDNKTYDLHLSPAQASAGDLAVGAEVMVTATFETNQYSVQQITVTRAAGSPAK